MINPVLPHRIGVTFTIPPIRYHPQNDCVLNLANGLQPHPAAGRD